MRSECLDRSRRVPGDLDPILAVAARPTAGAMIRSRPTAWPSRRQFTLDLLPRRPPRLAAIVLSFGRVELTARAVRSLQRSSRAIDEIVVVDNDPDDSFRPLLTSFAAPPTYLPNGVNLGFAGGMNRGLRLALARGADRLLIVNSDAELPPDCVARLELALDEHPDAGIVAPLLLARADPNFVASAGFAFSERSGRARQTGFGRRRAELAFDPWRAVTAASGCVLLLRRELLERIGLFDEEFFFSFEDLELCLRARRAGFAVGLVGDVHALHEGGASLPESSPARIYFATRNHLIAAARGAPLANPIARSLRTLAILAFNLAHAVLTSSGPLPARLGAFGAGARRRPPRPTRSARLGAAPAAHRRNLDRREVDAWHRLHARVMLRCSLVPVRPGGSPRPRS